MVAQNISDYTEHWPEDISTSNLVVLLQKLARNGSYYTPSVRSRILTEAAKRLQQYRNQERARG